MNATATDLVEAAILAAKSIESHNVECFGQSESNGVAVEARVKGLWMVLNYVDADDRIDSVRFYDATGSVSDPCSTPAEVEAERSVWIEAIDSQIESDESDAAGESDAS